MLYSTYSILSCFANAVYWSPGWSMDVVTCRMWGNLLLIWVSGERFNDTRKKVLWRNGLKFWRRPLLQWEICVRMRKKGHDTEYRLTYVRYECTRGSNSDQLVISRKGTIRTDESKEQAESSHGEVVWAREGAETLKDPTSACTEGD